MFCLAVLDIVCATVASLRSSQVNWYLASNSIRFIGRVVLSAIFSKNSFEFKFKRYCENRRAHFKTFLILLLLEIFNLSINNETCYENTGEVNKSAMHHQLIGDLIKRIKREKMVAPRMVRELSLGC